MNALVADAAGTLGSLSPGVSGDRIAAVNLDQSTVSQSVMGLLIRGMSYGVQS